MKFKLILLASSLFHQPLAAQDWSRYLPQSGFTLLESSVIPEGKPMITSSEEDGYLVLRSTLSPQWQKGIYFNLQNARVTVPGVGAANLVKSKEGLSWTTETEEATFSKKGSMSLSQRAGGCELSWSFTVISRGQVLLNEKGRMGYACRTKNSLAISPPPTLE